MEPEDSLRHLQVPVPCPYPEPDQSNQITSWAWCTPWIRVLIEKLTRLQLVKKNSPHFMEPDDSLRHLQVPVTCPYPQPDQSNQITSCAWCTSWIRVLLEKLTCLQLVKKYSPHFMEPEDSLSLARSIQSDHFLCLVHPMDQSPYWEADASAASQKKKNSPQFYGTRKFTNKFTSARNLSLPWASSIQSDHFLLGALYGPLIPTILPVLVVHRTFVHTYHRFNLLDPELFF